VSQFDKDDVEAIGLVKFDFLGLTTLTILDWAVRYMRALDPAAATSTLEIAAARRRADLPLSLRAARPTAVFQFESRGMRDMLKRAKPDRFEDIIALVALYRPGPMDLIPDFIARKHGRERVEYPHPRSSRCSAPTYGDHGVPGAGDADRAGARRLLARRRRPAAPRDGQEEARGDGEAALQIFATARRRTASPRARPTRSST
jgi:hypothetical protein